MFRTILSRSVILRHISDRLASLFFSLLLYSPLDFLSLHSLGVINAAIVKVERAGGLVGPWTMRACYSLGGLPVSCMSDGSKVRDKTFGKHLSSLLHIHLFGWQVFWPKILNLFSREFTTVAMAY